MISTIISEQTKQGKDASGMVEYVNKINDMIKVTTEMLLG